MIGKKALVKRGSYFCTQGSRLASELEWVRGRVYIMELCRCQTAFLQLRSDRWKTVAVLYLGYSCECGNFRCSAKPEGARGFLASLPAVRFSLLALI